MAWSTNIRLDEGKTDVGTASATWMDPTHGTFTHAERVALTAANRDAFIARAIAARDTWLTRQGRQANLETNLLDALTAEDTL